MSITLLKKPNAMTVFYALNFIVNLMCHLYVAKAERFPFVIKLHVYFICKYDCYFFTPQRNPVFEPLSQKKTLLQCRGPDDSSHVTPVLMHMCVVYISPKV